jgi:outer membrane protein OmpA-like peptidoglycan-associated protein
LLSRLGARGWVSLLAFTLVGASAFAVAQQKPDVKGSTDHPLISRIDGARIAGYDQKEFDEYRLITGPFTGYRDGKLAGNLEDAIEERNSIRLEGKVTRLTYELPANRSTLEVVRSFQTALTKAGFKILYQCANRECAGSDPGGTGTSVWLSNFSYLLLGRGGFRGDAVVDDRRYLAAHLSRPEGDVHVSVFAIGLDEPLARVDLVEASKSESLVRVTAGSLAKDIAKLGSVAVYDIFFDTNAAELKPESRPALSAIAELLKADNKLRLIVVGHTDSVGTLDRNMDLSLRRAQAVVASLVSQHGVERDRLDARGVGPLAPVAPNDTEQNRSKNRRVQLLPQ